VLWIGATQTLGRYVAEREAHSRDWGPVVSSVRHWQIGLVVAFVLGALLASPLLTGKLFEDPWLTGAFIVAVVLYAPEYFRRGIFNGHRQSFRLGAQIVAESASRVLVAAVLLAVGWGVFGPALAIVLAPLIGVLAVRPAPVPPAEREGEPFSTWGAFRFAGPVLACMAFAQALMNGGPILARLLGGTDAQVSVLAAAVILTRIPQYVLSPAIGALLPRASRVLSTEGRAAFDRFVVRAVGVVSLVGVLMVVGTWLFGGWGMRLFASFGADREVLVALAAMAAFYLLSETLNQGLFALGHGRLAALGWFVGLLASAVCMATLGAGIVERVSYSLALGTFVAAVAQAVFYLVTRMRPGVAAGN
jgi:O-antigen/teichoic acid export membrane protein